MDGDSGRMTYLPGGGHRRSGIEYDQYWVSEGFWGQSSFEDVEEVGEHILALPGSSLLDVGCGMGALVRYCLSQGLDARGIDIAPSVVEYGNRISPGRFSCGSVLALPCPDRSVDIVACTDVLEYISPENVPKALCELARVTRRWCYLRICLTPSSDNNRYHLAVRTRDWWEELILNAGFRRAAQCLWYDVDDTPGRHLVCAYERIPRKGTVRFDRAWLEERRLLHSDMLRQTGVRADAHLMRYKLAAGMVCDNDTVLDLGCGMGYGASVLLCGPWGTAKKVFAVDNSREAIDYAKGMYADGRVEYRLCDAADLSFLPCSSVDLVVALELLEHVEDDAVVLAEVNRVLRPGGGFICSVPNDWTDPETGEDPSPHHVRAYTLDSLRAALPGNLREEKVWMQNAGQGPKFPEKAPRLCLVERAEDADAEWWIWKGMKEPAVRMAVPYARYERYENIPDCHFVAFSRHFPAPQLVKTVVNMGDRARSKSLLLELAASFRHLFRDHRPSRMACLCVEGYAAYSEPCPAPEHFSAILAQIEQECSRSPSPAEPFDVRWQISLMHLLGLMQLKSGRLEKAREAFERCAGTDWRPFSTLIATKVVASSMYLGACHERAGRIQEASGAYRKGMETALEALRGAGVEESLGTLDAPVKSSFPELADILRIAGIIAQRQYALANGVSDPKPIDTGNPWYPARVWNRLQNRNVRHAQANARLRQERLRLRREKVRLRREKVRLRRENARQARENARLAPYEASFNHIMNKPAVRAYRYIMNKPAMRAYRKAKGLLRRCLRLRVARARWRQACGHVKERGAVWTVLYACRRLVKWLTGRWLGGILLPPLEALLIRLEDRQCMRWYRAQGKGGGPLTLSHMEYKRALERNPYYSERWEYYKEAFRIIRRECPERVLELGPGGLPLVKSSDRMDKGWVFSGLTYRHDATVFPWPVEDSRYDLFIALQVWEHLEGKQKEAFQEVMRIARTAILSFPYKWDCQSVCHNGIDEEVIAEWTLHVEPEEVILTGDQSKKASQRIMYFFRFEG